MGPPSTRNGMSTYDGSGLVPSVVIVVSHPIQYYAPLYRALACRTDLKIHVLFHCRAGSDEFYDAGFGRSVKWDVPLLDGYPHSFLSSSRRLGGLKVAVLTHLLRHKPDVVLLYGYSSSTNLLALLLSKAARWPVLVRGDTRLASYHSLRGVKAQIKRCLFSLFDGFIAIGTLNREYYQSYGVAPQKISFAPFSVNNSRFHLGEAERSQKRIALRRTLQVDDDAIVVLFAAKMIPCKRPFDLIDAFNRLAHGNPRLHLLFVGSGPDEANVRAKANLLFPGRVSFLGFQNQTQMPGCFAGSDIFVLPSADEAWGLVINEAMASGLPVIASDGAGAAVDLVANSGAGVVYKAGDIDALAAALASLTESDFLREEMAQKAITHIAEWDVNATAIAVASVVHATVRA